MPKDFQIVIDESVDYAIIDALKNSGFSIFAVIDEMPSISYKRVLEIAYLNNSLLLTEDKDFGELVFRFQLKHKGILLIRMINAKSNEKADAVYKSN